MTALIIIGSVLLFLAFLLFIGIKITIAYDGNVSLWVKVLFVKIKLIPKKESRGPRSMSKSKAERIKQRLAKKRAKKLEKKKDKSAKKAQGKKEKKSLSEILDIIDLSKKLLGEVVKRLFKHLRIYAIRIKLKIAMEDAAKTAIAYGAVTQAINLLFPILESVKNFKSPKKNEIDVQADFLSEESEIDICFAFKLRVWQLLHIALSALITFIKHKISKEEENDKSAEPKQETN